MKVSSSIFREYDIRGIAGTKFDPKVVEEYERWYGPFPGITINLETAEAIGNVYGQHIRSKGGKQVLVGYELRPYANELKAAFIKGILETGIDVEDAGKTTTPLIYFLTAHKGYDGGVNITGSHNVYFYNGFKMTERDAAPVYGQNLQKFYQQILNDAFVHADTPGKITYLENPFTIFLEYITNRFTSKRKPRIVVDCGNGTAGLFAADLITGLGCKLAKGLYMEPDSSFPNHIPDPESLENMRDLMSAVIEEKADLGIAFDADGDRVGFIDEKGTFHFADELLLVMAHDTLKRHPGKKVLFDVKCTRFLEELIPQMGGIPLMHPTGHAIIKDSFHKDPNIIIGGEISSHYFFAENYYKIDDAFFAVAYILSLYDEFEGTFSEMLAFVPKSIRTFEIKLPCDDLIKEKVVQQITQHFQKIYHTRIIDGVRIDFTDTSWAMIRPSNTAPYICVRVEGNTEAEVIRIKNILADELEKHQEIGDTLDRKAVNSFTGRLGYR